jgi:hypothetical protein
MIVVHARFDDETSRWWATSDDDSFGLVVEADSFDELRKLVPELMRDLIDAGAPVKAGTPIEIIAHASAAVPA